MLFVRDVGDEQLSELPDELLVKPGNAAAVRPTDPLIKFSALPLLRLHQELRAGGLPSSCAQTPFYFLTTMLAQCY